MGKKRTILMDENQKDDLLHRNLTENKYSRRDAFDLPEGFDELEALNARETQENAGKGKEDSDEAKADNKKVAGVKKAHYRSKKFRALKKTVVRNEAKSLEIALKEILNVSRKSFDESIELHVNTRKENLSGKISLPHGTGKEKKVAIFNDEILKDIENQKIDFDILIAKKEDMGKLARHAKFLGPRGLMPNPKNGTVSDRPEEAAKAFGGGNLQFRSERKASVVHLTIGKVSFGSQKLSENVQAVFKAIDPAIVKKAFVCTSMSPAVRLDLATVK